MVVVTRSIICIILSCWLFISCKAQRQAISIFYQNIENTTVVIPSDLDSLELEEVSVDQMYSLMKNNSGIEIGSKSRLFDFISSIELVYGGLNYEVPDSVYTKDSGWILFPKESKEQMQSKFKSLNPEIYAFKKLNISDKFESILFKIDISTEFEKSSDWFLFNYKDSNLHALVKIASLYVFEDDSIQAISTFNKNNEIIIQQTGLEPQKLQITDSGKITVIDN